MYNFKNEQNMQAINSLAKESIEKIANLSEKSFDKVEQIAALNISATHEAVTSAMVSAKKMIDLKTPKEAFEMFSGVFKDSNSKIGSYYKHLNEITTSE